MLSELTLAGSFRSETEVVGDKAPCAWRCPLCSTSNEIADDDPSPRCSTCHRARSPDWLRLEDSGLQITLGSRVFLTSAGGSKSVSVVVAINYVQKALTLLRVKTTRNVGTQQGDISFHEVVLNASQMQQQLGPLDDEHEKDCVIENYGICGECRGVFHVAQGDSQSQYAHEDKISELRKELQQLGEQKQRLAREKAYERTLECAEEIKLNSKQLQVAKRELEFLNPVFCPFCGWSSSQ
ncbi:hypothetical protein PC129_g2971 [Phytophthora cactorum]|uniref:Uncharacterized protein n=1 Tax=Phytophthora cactorum TaxID=29920 RepID=A0A329S4E0_9STRA|nr:hypothetical protein Pcac1_g19180 [Phytophthora cactorum]KAG2823759.1 hypothetical protein PC111_g10101 [Phytophthora cactorum]KAG2840381.1 hypothetical protein PC112_g3757 [Phytophthora cactorum]KAG2864214.1 hypothetical protein PC113_g4773 [Phytophthora cactorum]KAG2922521.1 hypothetical protein PC114_g5222 [Phytophthora cactorum]